MCRHMGAEQLIPKYMIQEIRSQMKGKHHFLSIPIRGHVLRNLEAAMSKPAPITKVGDGLDLEVVRPGTPDSAQLVSRVPGMPNFVHSSMI